MRAILLIMIGLSVFAWADFNRDDATQIVTDNNTGLQWQDDVNTSKNWTDAIGYCEALSLGGHTDWRLPNFNELYYIADKSKRNPAIDSVFKNVVSHYHWSSTTQVNYENDAWMVSFYTGSSAWSGKGNNGYVRCVRDGQ